jgi:hypothetical protein
MKTIVSFCLISFLILTASCKKDKEKDITIFVPAYLKQMLPYTNGQIIRYTKGSGSPVEATVSVTTDFSLHASCASCAPYSREEYITYDFNVGTLRFMQLGIDNRPNIFMSIMSPEHNFQIGGGFDFLTETGIAQPICNGPRQTCIPSIILNGKTYLNVLEISNGNPPFNQINKAYYTVSQGLIGFVYGSGLTYSLE